MFVGTLLGTSYLANEESEQFDEIVANRAGNLLELRKLVKFVYKAESVKENLTASQIESLEAIKQTITETCKELHFCVNFQKGTLRAKTFNEIFPNANK